MKIKKNGRGQNKNVTDSSPPSKLRRWAVPVKVALSGRSDTSVTVCLSTSDLDQHKWATSTQSLMSDQAIGGGQSSRESTEAGQSQTAQWNISYLHLSSFYTYSRDQGTRSFYKLRFFFNKVVQNNTFYSLYKNNDPAEKSKARLKGRRGWGGGKRASRPSVRHVSHVITVLPSV